MWKPPYGCDGFWYRKITKDQQTWVFGNLSLSHSCLDLVVPISKAVCIRVKPETSGDGGDRSNLGIPKNWFRAQTDHNFPLVTTTLGPIAKMLQLCRPTNGPLAPSAPSRAGAADWARKGPKSQSFRMMPSWRRTKMAELLR